MHHIHLSNRAILRRDGAGKGENRRCSVNMAFVFFQELHMD